MLDTILTSVDNSSISLGNVVSTIIVSFLLGLVISVIYIKTYKKGATSQNFVITLILLPTIIAAIIMLVGSNVARAFSLAGAFSLIKFRSAPGDPKDISYVFFSVAVGLACGMGFFSYGAIFTFLVSIFMILLNVTNYAAPKVIDKQLKITIPENLDYKGVFDDIFLKYAKSYELVKVKTIDLGSLYELNYRLILLKQINEKNFIDELRCRNGNLNITLSMQPTNSENF